PHRLLLRADAYAHARRPRRDHAAPALRRHALRDHDHGLGRRPGLRELRQRAPRDRRRLGAGPLDPRRPRGLGDRRHRRLPPAHGEVGLLRRDARPLGGPARRAHPAGREVAVGGRFVSDGFSVFARALAAGGGLLLVMLASAYTRRMDRGHGEFYGILLLATCGVMLVSGVADLMSLFVSLELVTISSYVLAAFRRN